MKPVIGITCPMDSTRSHYFLPRAYSEAVYKAGGIPVILPIVEKKKDIERFAARIQGLLLSGGPDLDPVFFGEEPEPGIGEITPERDVFELCLTCLALKGNIPILAICRGMQVLNVAAGGTIIQDIGRAIEKPLKHMQNAPRWYPTHGVELLNGTLIYEVTGNSRLRVNSFHHQAVGDIAAKFIVSALAGDKVVEAIEARDSRFIIGVQWHPECMVEKDQAALKLFKAFISAASNTEKQQEKR